jgi:stage II sporulation protein D
MDAGELRERWGSDYDRYMEKITGAVRETDGECIYYGGEPILAAFHSSSAGATASSREVWGGELPYLVSVDSPESAERVPDYVSTVTVSADDFREAILAARPEADFSGGLIGELVYSDSGRLLTAVIGGAELTGRELRAIFGLRSTAADIESDGDTVVFTTTGYGHGVGLSQYGADELARRGMTCEEILAHYYPGTSLGPLPDLSI